MFANVIVGKNDGIDTEVAWIWHTEKKSMASWTYMYIIELDIGHSISYNIACTPSEDLGQAAYLHSLISLCRALDCG